MNLEIIVDPEAQSLLFKIFNFISLSMGAIQNDKCYIFRKYNII